jgi:hypothetical protein
MYINLNPIFKGEENFLPGEYTGIFYVQTEKDPKF